MMPVLLCSIGEENIVKKVGGSPDVKRHLEELGIVAGSDITVVAEANENIIVKIKETRVAIGRELAQRIMV